MNTNQQVLIHCKPSLLNDIKAQGLAWSYSQQFGQDEVDVVVTDIEYDPEHYYQDPDEQLCNYYELDYDQVNCIEAA